MMHAKVMVVDGVWSMFGSANFDNRSLELNDELNVAVSEPRARGALPRATSRQDLDASRSGIDARGLAQRVRCSTKVRERFWSVFGEVF